MYAQTVVLQTSPSLFPPLGNSCACPAGPDEESRAHEVAQLKVFFLFPGSWVFHVVLQTGELVMLGVSTCNGGGLGGGGKGGSG